MAAVLILRMVALSPKLLYCILIFARSIELPYRFITPRLITGVCCQYPLKKVHHIFTMHLESDLFVYLTRVPTLPHPHPPPPQKQTPNRSRPTDQESGT